MIVAFSVRTKVFFCGSLVVTVTVLLTGPL